MMIENTKFETWPGGAPVAYVEIEGRPFWVPLDQKPPQDGAVVLVPVDAGDSDWAADNLKATIETGPERIEQTFAPATTDERILDLWLQLRAAVASSTFRPGPVIVGETP